MRKPYIISAGFNPGGGKKLVEDLVTIWYLSIDFPIPTQPPPNNYFTINIPTFGWNGEWRGTYYETYNGVFNKRFSPDEFETNGANSNGCNYLDRLREEGYDIIILSYNEWTDKMKNNAALFIKLIDEVNNIKFNNGFYFENVVSGYSAGGVSTRLALAWMESMYKQDPVTYHHPHTKMWVSAESENQGANVPLGLQHLLWYQANPFNIFTLGKPLQVTIDGINQIVASVALQFNFNQTARELTAYIPHYTQTGAELFQIGTELYRLDPNFLSADPGPDYLRDELLNLFASVPGNSLSGYPEFCRRIGVAQGSGLGEETSHTDPVIFSSELYSIPEELQIPIIPPWCGTYTHKFPSSQKTTLARWWSDVNPGSPIFEGTNKLDGSWTVFPKSCDPSCTWCFGPIELPSVVIIFSEYTIPKPTVTQNYDDIPASTQAAQIELGTMSAYPIYNWDWLIPLQPSSSYYDPKLHAFAPTVSTLDLHNPDNGYAPADNFTSPVDLGLMQINPIDQEEDRRFGFPFINHPVDHYQITPYDAVFAIGDNNFDVNGNPKPTNQFHVEDPQIAIGNYLARIEVAPEELYLSNMSVGSSKQSGDANQYIAEYEARNAIFVGNGIYYEKDYQYYLTPDGDFRVDNGNKAIIHSGYEIEFLPGTEITYGSELEAYIEPYDCENLMLKNLNVENDAGNDMNEYFKTEMTKLESKKQEKEEKYYIKVFPNPNYGMLTISTNIRENEMTVTVQELTGKQVYNERFTQILNNDINIKYLDNGIYLLRVKCSGKSEIFKIIVAK
ncbi:MAG: T9SS type A sorting domain-containing protein [Bacteroidia bacterium]|nr:T9SS type A sorting domain-containing protein [Bacteroidia bacterium]